MFVSDIYYDGMLIVGKMSGVVEPHSFINAMFWQIDSSNLGEVQPGFCQLLFDENVESVTVTEDDIRRIIEINTGIGSNLGHFKTALVLQHPEVIRLARLHQELASRHGLEVEIFNNFEQGFLWLGYQNPNPQGIPG